MKAITIEPKVEEVVAAARQPMVPVRYCGPEEVLKGKTALAMKLQGRPGKVAVQFDDLSLTVRAWTPGEGMGVVGVMEVADIHLSHGWHEFDEADFAPY